MNTYKFINQLNEKQRSAVIAEQGNFLVLAGAGSGKTSVLVNRIAWLIIKKKCLLNSILAVTFTNKAALDMTKRIQNIVNNKKDMWVGTFHGLAHRLLRIHYLEANLIKNFQIIDIEDQIRLIKCIISNMNLDEKKWSPQKIIYYINSQKDKGLRPKDIDNFNSSVEKTKIDIYKVYQDKCNILGLIDFSEIMLRSYELWLNNPNILKYYNKVFTNILVDEFQDTNYIQYSWIKILAKNNINVMAVGDDDQSIYSWRGAQIKNIQYFLKDFTNVKIIRLEQNYRSTNNILLAANTLIAYNHSRLGKNLWTNDIKGELIKLYFALNEIDEARFIIQCIKNNQKIGILLKDHAILYRNNIQSRILEEELLKTNLPYYIYGGTNFFERQEIKDVLAYLRLIINHDDNIAFERIINKPIRGIGKHTLSIIHQKANDQKLTLWKATKLLLVENKINSRTKKSLQNFIKFIKKFRQIIELSPLHIFTDKVIKDSGIWNMYNPKQEEKNQLKIDNLKELVNAIRQFIDNNTNENLTTLQLFLSQSILEKDNNSEFCNDKIQLMTLHSAKGLEFHQVFIIGMEEGIFPKHTLFNNEFIEEERRLAYVGITRAMKKLTMTYAKKRWLYGKEVFNQPSRFINELPKICIQKISFKD